MPQPLEIILTVRLYKEHLQEAIKKYCAEQGQVFGEGTEYEYEYDPTTKQINSLIIVERRTQANG